MAVLGCAALSGDKVAAAATLVPRMVTPSQKPSFRILQHDGAHLMIVMLHPMLLCCAFEHYVGDVSTFCLLNRRATFAL